MRCAILVAFACAIFAQDALSLSMTHTTDGGCEAFKLKVQSEEVEQAEKVAAGNCNCKMLTALPGVNGCAMAGAKSMFAHRPACYRQCCGGLAYQPLTLEQKERGTKPLGYEGSRARLQSKLLKAAQGEPLKVLVLGGSMTEGTGTSDKSKRWTAELERRLKAKIGNQVTVLNRAFPASTSMTAIVHLEEIVAEKPDIVLVDYAINDAVPDAGLNQQEKKSTRFSQVTNTLARSLLAMPTEPAVAYLETFTHDTLFGYNCQTSVNEFPHWNALNDLEVPVVSYTEAACEPGVKIEQIWDKVPYSVSDGPQHPKDAVHKRLGALMAHFILDNTEQACTAGKAAAPVRNLKVKTEQSQMVKCASDTKTKLDPLFDKKKKKWMLNQNIYAFPQNLAKKNFPASADKIWSFADDRSNDGWFVGMPKYGWIASPYGKAGKIEFDVESSGQEHSAVLMEYLTSYDTAKATMGNATCWFDDKKDAAVTLDSKVEQRVSLSDVAVLPFPAGSAAGNHKLKCESDGKKFKILSLRSC